MSYSSFSGASENGTLAVPVARLCERCEVLSFDDSALEGFSGASSDDETQSQLRFGDKDEFGVTPLNYDVIDSFPSFPVLERSAKEGCDFCARLRLIFRSDDLLELLHPLERGWSRARIRAQLVWRDFTDTISRVGLSSLTVRLDLEEPDVAYDIDMPIQSASGSAARWLRTMPLNSLDCLADGNTDWMIKMLKQCEDHRHSIPNPLFCPSRLIDVRDSKPLRLVLKEDIIGLNGCRPRYMALSYVWGPSGNQSEQLKTYSNNLADRRLGIREEDLKLTIRDAVRLARVLSIPYLWVDALCILQDPMDPTDWQKECAVMGQIYGNSEVTVCAASSKSVDDGLLKSRYEPLFIPFQSTINPEARGAYRLQSCLVGALFKVSSEPL